MVSDCSSNLAMSRLSAFLMSRMAFSPPLPMILACIYKDTDSAGRPGGVAVANGGSGSSEFLCMEPCIFLHDGKRFI
jgi:hypothetical protein